MKSFSLSTMLTVILLASMIGTVSALGYPPEVIIVQPPALVIVDHHVSGVLAFTYPNGVPALLDPPKMTVKICGSSGCTTVDVVINNDGSFSIPLPVGLTGQVTLYIVAGSIRDSYGNTFPSVDTLIGSLTVPSPSPPIGGTAPGSTAAQPSLFRIANFVTTSPGSGGVVLLLLASLVVVGAVLVAPRKSNE